jgi:hypothetical protein
MRIIATGMASTLALTLIPQQQATAQYQQALPAAVAACYSQPTICAVVGAAAGGWILMRRGQKVLCTWDGCQPLRIDDPDQPIETTMVDYVWGTDDADARRNCRDLLSRQGMKFDRVRRNSRNSKRYQCWGWSNHPETTHVPDRRR